MRLFAYKHGDNKRQAAEGRQQMRMNTSSLFLEANAYSLSALIVNKGSSSPSLTPHWFLMTQRWVCVRKGNANRVESNRIETRRKCSEFRFRWSFIPPPPLEFRVIKKHSKTINYSTIRSAQSNSIYGIFYEFWVAAHFVYLAFRLFDSGPVQKRNMCAAALNPHKLTWAPSSCICCTERKF